MKLYALLQGWEQELRHQANLHAFPGFSFPDQQAHLSVLQVTIILIYLRLSMKTFPQELVKPMMMTAQISYYPQIHGSSIEGLCRV